MAGLEPTRPSTCTGWDLSPQKGATFCCPQDFLSWMGTLTSERRWPYPHGQTVTARPSWSVLCWVLPLIKWAFLSPYLVHITSSCWLASLGLEFSGPVISMNNIQVPCGSQALSSTKAVTSAFLSKDRVWLAPEVLVSQTFFSSLLTGGAGLLFTGSPSERGWASVCCRPGNNLWLSSVYLHLLEFRLAGWTATKL